MNAIRQLIARLFPDTEMQARVEGLDQEVAELGLCCEQYRAHVRSLERRLARTKGWTLEQFDEAEALDQALAIDGTPKGTAEWAITY